MNISAATHLRPVAAATSPNPEQPSPAPPARRVPDVTIAAVGDLMLARRVETLMLEHGAVYPFARIRASFEGADIVTGNLEGTFTRRGTALTKKYTFRTDPALAAGLKEAGFHAVSLANNHATDFGVVSLDDTRAALDGVSPRPGSGTWRARPSTRRATS